VVPIVETVTDPVVPVVETVTDPVVPIVETVTDPVVSIVNTIIDPVAPVIDTLTDPVRPIVDTVLPPTSPLGGSEDSAPGSSDTPADPEPAVAPEPVTLARFTPDRVTSVDALEDATAPNGGAKATLDTALSSAAAAAISPWLTGPFALATLELIRKSSSTAPASAAPDEMPGLPGAPSGGGALSAPGGGASSALYALLVAFAALALLRFDRLQLRPVPRRRAAFVALLERPG
ncbi:MAG: hypothetical protein ABWY95_08490, partial [Thermoleophilaceae bacterium]